MAMAKYGKQALSQRISSRQRRIKISMLWRKQWRRK